MKRFLILLFMLFCGVAFAATETINWYMDGNTYATTTCQTGGDIILPTTPYKYGYTFQGWAEYIPIEYIESTGTQWIKFGSFYPDRKYETIIDSLDCAFGMNHAYYMGPIGSNTWRAENITTTIPGQSRQTNIQYYYIPHLMDNTVYYILTNGTDTFTSTWPINTSIKGWAFGVCGLTTSSTRGFAVPGKIYSVRVFENDILIHDLIPVLDKNGTPCMYDKVSQQFFYNSGTGDFIAGPVITE